MSQTPRYIVRYRYQRRELEREFTTPEARFEAYRKLTKTAVSRLEALNRYDRNGWTLELPVTIIL